jgi:hypothetical protein
MLMHFYQNAMQQMFSVIHRELDCGVSSVLKRDLGLRPSRQRILVTWRPILSILEHFDG